MSTHLRWLAMLLAFVTTILAIQNSPVSASASGCSSWYTVQSGDTLSRIASLHGTSWPQLQQINGLANPNLITVGERLCLASTATAPPPSLPPTSSTSAPKVSSLEFCRSSAVWAKSVWSWAIPPSCYAGVYVPNSHNYRYEPGFGWCNWWAEEIHPNEDIFTAPKHTTPRVGAAVYFPPGDQGASSIGHWAGEVIAIRGSWLLISEMNDTWRGAGFGRVNYRYVLNDGHIRFIY